MSEILFAAALPFVLYGIALGFFYLGRALAEWAFSKREKDR